VAFDPDAAGQSAAARTHALFASHGIAPLAAITFPPGTDPADRLARRGPPVLLGALETSTRPLADLVIDARLARFARSLEFTDGKFKALDAVAPLIARLPAGQVARQVARVSEHIGLTYGEVTAPSPKQSTSWSEVESAHHSWPRKTGRGNYLAWEGILQIRQQPGGKPSPTDAGGAASYPLVSPLLRPVALGAGTGGLAACVRCGCRCRVRSRFGRRSGCSSRSGSGCRPGWRRRRCTFRMRGCRGRRRRSVPIAGCCRRCMSTGR
jgi:hypothetical protein